MKNRYVLCLIFISAFFVFLSSITFAEECSATIDNIHSLTISCGDVNYNVSFLACGYIGDNPAGLFTISFGGTSESIQLPVSQSKTLSNGVSFKLNSMSCPANYSEHPSAVFSISSSQSQTCTDSDGGKNYYIKGTVTQGGGSSPDCCGVDLGNPNCYATSGYLVERFCNAEGNLDTEIVPCSNLCLNGVCLSSPPSCTDTDGGKNYYVKGQTTLSTGANLVDGCPTNSPYKAGITLLEAYCTNSSPFVVYQEYYCPYGCSNGACKSSNSSICSTHNTCSQACDNLGITSHWSGSKSNSWTGSCTLGTYGCMTGDCCIGQCNYKTTGDCYCARTNTVDIYGAVCPTGTTCGSDCYCHPTETNTTCTDSDGGKNYFTKGCISSCTYTNQSGGCGLACDTCSGNTLTEGFCEGSQSKTTNYLCPTNYICKDGACVPESSCKNLNEQCSYNEQCCSKICSSGVCKSEGVCSNHAQCSQACDNLGINFKWSGQGTSYKSWTGVCPSNVYGCMTGQCCIGQCNYKTTGDCYCARTNTVDIYGAVCPTGSTCGSDCYCHPTSEIPKTEKYMTVDLWEIFFINETATDPYVWRLYDINKDFYSSETLNLHSFQECYNTSEGRTCKYIRQFQAIKEGKAVIVLQKVNVTDNSVAEEKYFYITIKEMFTTAYLNKPFELSFIATNSRYKKAKVVDYKNMIIELYSVGENTAGIGVSIPESPTIKLELNKGESKDAFGANIKLVDVIFDWEGKIPAKATFLVTLKTTDFEFKIDTNKNVYSIEETVKINAVLTGGSNFNFENAVVEIKVKDPNGNVVNLPVEKAGTVAVGCVMSTTTNAYTCPINNQYLFYSFYKIPPNASLGSYSISGKAVVGSNEKNAYNSFRVEKTFSDYVDVEVYPEKISTEVGNSVEYKVTVTDKHPSTKCECLPCPIYMMPSPEWYAKCKNEGGAVAESTTDKCGCRGPTICLKNNITSISGGVIAAESETTTVAKCGTTIYNYLISVDGLPYHSVHPTVVSVHAGSSNSFVLRVFPSPVKTAEGIKTAIRKTESTSFEDERTLSISGKPIAEVQSPASTTEETIPVSEAVFKFTVKASLREDSSVSDSDMGFLHVKFVQNPEPPSFPELEKMDIELKKGWNLISIPGKGTGFSQGSCTGQKPIALVYLQDQRKYVDLEEALTIMGKEELLEYLSTHSFWIYSYEDCKIGFSVKSYSTYSDLSLTAGWNLIGTTKDMIGETLISIKGTCAFEKIYIWDASSKEWTEKTENDLIEKMGQGILIKAKEECNFKQNTLQPPPFPEGD